MFLDRFWMFFMDFDGFLGTSTDMWPPTGHGGGILLLGADEAANSRLLMPGTRRFYCLRSLSRSETGTSDTSVYTA